MNTNNLEVFKAAIYRIDNKNGFIHLKHNGNDISLRTKQWAKAHSSEYFDGIISVCFKGELGAYEPWILDYVTDCLAGIHRTWENVARETAYADMAYDRVIDRSRKMFLKYYESEIRQINEVLGR